MAIERITRTIEVFRSGRILVEREGKTLSIQVAGPNGSGIATMVLDVEAADALRSVLADATAIPGSVVSERKPVTQDDLPNPLWQL